MGWFTVTAQQSFDNYVIWTIPLDVAPGETWTLRCASSQLGNLPDGNIYLAEFICTPAGCGISETGQFIFLGLDSRGMWDYQTMF